jgi:hypothetical protein
VVVPVLWYLVGHHGAAGVAAGSTFGVALYTVSIGLAWHVRVSPADGSAMVGFGLRVLAVAAVTGAASLATSAGLAELGLPDLVRLGGGGAVGTTVYLVMARLLGLDEVGLVVDRIGAGVRRLRERGRDPASASS